MALVYRNTVIFCCKHINIVSIYPVLVLNVFKNQVILQENFDQT